ITRGFIYARESEILINTIKKIAREEVEKCLEDKVMEWQVLKGGVKKSIENFIYDKTKRRPSVFPIIMEI
ncbi:MAG: ribonuclease J, partial [Erysipelotrichaceae bacterium]